MALDYFTIAQIKEELCVRITGAKVDKIRQPQRDMVVFTLRGEDSTNLKLLISANVQNPRMHLTEYSFENPDSPPMFCMLLRKYLTGARIETVTQPAGERILEIVLNTSTVLGDKGTMRLVIELFGHIPNIILIGNDDIIIDCLRRIGGEPDKRMLLPGLKYILPQRLPALHTTEIQTASQTQSGSISEKLDAIYTKKSKQEGMQIRSASLIKTVKTIRKRLSRKLAAQHLELDETENREYYRECADIIMANLHHIKKGDKILTADDFYAAGGEAKREIKLDPLKTPQKNAAKYYKEYSKAKNAVKHLQTQIENGEKELEYIDSVIEQLTRAENMQDLDEIRNELIQSGYIKLGKMQKNAKSAKKQEQKPMRFISSGGFQILAGRNNNQNDRLTFKIASRFDIWLHAQKIHGAHVIISSGGRQTDDRTLTEAAEIAAYYSAARDAGKVPIDYTQVKYVKRQPGSRPGMVLYTDYKTITVQTDETKINKLKCE